ncbi:MFS transporter [Flavobacterium sp. AC]|uniref:MFS transporter n=1 Tax=Flavobacterium azizsancarii TaxID=2961580 RepID=A0ABT4WER0_9FLAO|nr:MFS transporter [Flavobacterium azizsancarii]MDA6071041.1 MFS transporter [Flavobacterium azizsancarii]
MNKLIGSPKKKAKINEWLILAIIILALIPVTIDATILHIAIPSLTLSLGATGNEVIWIIDTYPLIMAGLLLPMGVLGDKIGHKKILIFGVSIFALASLFAGLSTQPLYLILSRALLALGGSMIMPVTLAIIRQTFPDQEKCGRALGIWAAVGTMGAAIGPLIGGILVEYYSWEAVFLINIPLLLIVIPLIWFGVPNGISDPKKPWIFKDACLLLIGVIVFVYALKSIFKENQSLYVSAIAGLFGFLLLRWFFKKQKNTDTAMIDISLLQNKQILFAMLLCFVPMAVIVGFEFLLAQELQFVHKFSPINAGLFMIPFAFSSALAGPLTGYLIGKIGFRKLIITVLFISSFSFFMLSTLNFSSLTIPVFGWLVVLGFSLGMILMAATNSIMATAPIDKAGTAGSMESIAYELGTGLGIAFFGIVLSQVFIRKFSISKDLLSEIGNKSYNSISDVLIIANNLDAAKQQEMKNAAMIAFQGAHNIVLIVAGSILGILALAIIFSGSKKTTKLNL